jgi:hypothetical protein
LVSAKGMSRCVAVQTKIVEKFFQQMFHKVPKVPGVPKVPEVLRCLTCR